MEQHGVYCAWTDRPLMITPARSDRRHTSRVRLSPVFDQVKARLHTGNLPGWEALIGKILADGTLNRIFMVSGLSGFTVGALWAGWEKLLAMAFVPVILSGLLRGWAGGMLAGFLTIPCLWAFSSLWYGAVPELAWSDIVHTGFLTAVGASVGWLRDMHLRLNREQAEALRAEAARRIREMRLRALVTHASVRDEHLRYTQAMRLLKQIQQAKRQVKDTLDSIAPHSLEARHVLRKKSGVIEEAYRDIEIQTQRFSPPLLHTAGLEATLAWLCHEIEQAAPVSVHYTHDTLYTPLNQDLAIVLFQSVREMLDNAGRHATAQNIHVTLSQHGQNIVITVTDDGVGFDTAILDGHPYEGHGLGLFSVQERIACFGGTVAVVSRPGEGTCVMMRTPVKPPSAL